MKQKLKKNCPTQKKSKKNSSKTIKFTPERKQNRRNKSNEKTRTNPKNNREFCSETTNKNINPISSYKTNLFNIVDKQYLKIYTGPIDLYFLCALELEKSIEKILDIFIKRKICYTRINPCKFICSKTGISFGIEIFQLENLNDLFYYKFKQIQGNEFNFRKLSLDLFNEMES